MCGILGVMNHTDADRERLEHALLALAHRGPDGQGVFSSEKMIFGHRRLAIIDLTSDGSQPMSDESSRYTIVFNGEIFNYLELRSELIGEGIIFNTSSDTEVLLRAFDYWGPSMLGRLNGMWALAIWDERRKELFIARDRFGVKPLYYSSLGGRFIFASEPKAMFCLDARLATPSSHAIGRFFATNEVHAGEDTFYENIRSLAPGHFATIKLDMAVEPRRYWDYPRHGVASSTKAFDFGSLIESSVSLRLRSDVAVGLTLSGGLDSTAILAACAAQDWHPKCYTSVYGKHRGEERWASEAARIAGAPLESVDSAMQDWHATLEQAVYHLDSPSFSPAIVPLWAIMQRAREDNVPVLLEGQGADELLGGYPQYAPRLLHDLWKNCGPKEAWAGTKNLIRSFGGKSIFLWGVRQILPVLHAWWSSSRSGGSLLLKSFDYRGRRPGRRKSNDLFDLLRLDHSAAILPALLHYGDAISMAHGIESRLPFMDFRLVEATFATRPSLSTNGMTKAPVRDYLYRSGYGAIADRRDKAGYPTPVAAWAKDSGAQFVTAAISNPQDPCRAYLKEDAVHSVVARAKKGDAMAVFQLFKVATTVMWLRNLERTRSMA